MALGGYFWSSPGAGRFAYRVLGAGSAVSSVVGAPLFGLRNTGSQDRGMSEGHGEAVVDGWAASEVAGRLAANGFRAAWARSVEVISRKERVGFRQLQSPQSRSSQLPILLFPVIK